MDSHKIQNYLSELEAILSKAKHELAPCLQEFNEALKIEEYDDEAILTDFDEEESILSLIEDTGFSKSLQNQLVEIVKKVLPIVSASDNKKWNQLKNELTNKKDIQQYTEKEFQRYLNQKEKQNPKKIISPDRLMNTPPFIFLNVLHELSCLKNSTQKTTPTRPISHTLNLVIIFFGATKENLSDFFVKIFSDLENPKLALSQSFTKLITDLSFKKNLNKQEQSLLNIHSTLKSKKDKKEKAAHMVKEILLYLGEIKFTPETMLNRTIKLKLKPKSFELYKKNLIHTFKNTGAEEFLNHHVLMEKLLPNGDKQLEVSQTLFYDFSNEKEFFPENFGKKKYWSVYKDYSKRVRAKNVLSDNGHNGWCQILKKLTPDEAVQFGSFEIFFDNSDYETKEYFKDIKNNMGYLVDPSNFFVKVFVQIPEKNYYELDHINKQKGLYKYFESISYCSETLGEVDVTLMTKAKLTKKGTQVISKELVTYLKSISLTKEPNIPTVIIIVHSIIASLIYPDKIVLPFSEEKEKEEKQEKETLLAIEIKGYYNFDSKKLKNTVEKESDNADEKTPNDPSNLDSSIAIKGSQTFLSQMPQSTDLILQQDSVRWYPMGSKSFKPVPSEFLKDDETTTMIEKDEDKYYKPKVKLSNQIVGSSLEPQ